MNTICQDRTRTSAALSYARIDPHQFANALNGCPLATAGMGPQEYAGTRMSLRKQVGKSFANWTPLFANWIQLADPCQLHSHINQVLISKLASWQVGKSKSAANLPTGRKPAWMLGSQNNSVGENSPLPTGEVDTPDLGRSVHLVLESRPVVQIKGGRHHG
jgi:hypothetical protein